MCAEDIADIRERDHGDDDVDRCVVITYANSQPSGRRKPREDGAREYDGPVGGAGVFRPPAGKG